MAETIYARPRITYGYTDAWSNYDQHGDEIEFKVLEGRQVEQGNGYDDGGVYMLRAIGHKGMDKRLQEKALRDHYTGGNCQHEYDCCGCASYSAQARHVGRGEFSVRIRTTYNY